MMSASPTALSTLGGKNVLVFPKDLLLTKQYLRKKVSTLLNGSIDISIHLFTKSLQIGIGLKNNNNNTVTPMDFNRGWAMFSICGFQAGFASSPEN